MRNKWHFHPTQHKIKGVNVSLLENLEMHFAIVGRVISLFWIQQTYSVKEIVVVLPVTCFKTRK